MPLCNRRPEGTPGRAVPSRSRPDQIVNEYFQILNSSTFSGRRGRARGWLYPHAAHQNLLYNLANKGVTCALFHHVSPFSTKGSHRALLFDAATVFTWWLFLHDATGIPRIIEQTAGRIQGQLIDRRATRPRSVSSTGRMAAGLEDIAQKITQSLESIKQRENQVKLLEDAVADDRKNVEKTAEELEAERERIAEKERELEKEKKAMERYPVAEDDVVELNVQGKIMTTLRGTLTGIPDNVLAYLFNGRWEDKIHRDKEGRIFLDFIPQLFRVLLDYLTTLRLARATDEIPLPRLSGHRALEFQMMVRHLGLEDALYGGPQCFSRSLKSSSVMLSDDGMIATSDSDGMCFALGEGIYSNEKVEFVFEIQKLEEPWMFLGIIKESEALPGDNSFNGNPGAFGWAGLGGVWVGGYRQAGGQEMPLGILKAGLVAHLTLDCREGRDAVLELQTESDDALYQIDGLPKCEKWRLHINMVGCGDTIRLMDVKRHQK